MILQLIIWNFYNDETNKHDVRKTFKKTSQESLWTYICANKWVERQVLCVECRGRAVWSGRRVRAAVPALRPALVGRHRPAPAALRPAPAQASHAQPRTHLASQPWVSTTLYSIIIHDLLITVWLSSQEPSGYNIYNILNDKNWWKYDTNMTVQRPCSFL